MNTCDLASLIVDVQPNWGNPDELISVSALPDNQLIRQYFCDPRTGVSLLADYADSKLDGLFSACKTLEDASAKVKSLYSEAPLDASESNCVKALAVQTVLSATYRIANNRELGGDRQSHEAIVALVVSELRDTLNTFQT